MDLALSITSLWSRFYFSFIYFFTKFLEHEKRMCVECHGRVTQGVGKDRRERRAVCRGVHMYAHVRAYTRRSSQDQQLMDIFP